jgi:hypothetical protein
MIPHPVTYLHWADLAVIGGIILYIVILGVAAYHESKPTKR